jgi:HD-GYP domain-containing protein (c-di-GMP phosphodiesterase class II)
MAKFDPDFAIFGTFAADILEGVNIGDTAINYVNKACIELYGDLRGKTVFEIISKICGNIKKGQELLNKLNSEGMLAFEGKLNGKFVKFHSRIIDCRDEDSCVEKKFIQAGITDITESILLKRLLYGTSEALKRAARAADEDTGEHVVRINRYSELLARLFEADDKFVEDISKFAQLHDIGKIKVAEIIRLPRKLKIDEFNFMKKHSISGAEMVAGLDGLEMAYYIALEHHEKWDGSGYPKGKKKDKISLEARIVAIADVFDALVSARPYKDAFDYNRTFQIFEKGDGRVMPSHFDPELLHLFLEHYDEFVELHKQQKD